MQNDILNKVEESFLKAERYYNRTFPRPKVIFKRNGTTAGYARRDLSLLMFQLDLAESNKQDFMDNTVPHEVAHIIQFVLYPRSSAHGYEWKSIMTRVMNISPDRCHSYDTSVTVVKKQTTHLYSCGCGKEFNVTQTMHNKILKGSNRVCARCRGRLILKKMGNPYEQKLAALMKRMESASNQKV
jgi:SprT protein